MYTFPLCHGSHCLFETCVARVLEIMVIPTDCLIHRDAGMIDFHLLYSTIVSSISLKRKPIFDAFACF
jgi:hypothetical protein